MRMSIPNPTTLFPLLLLLFILNFVSSHPALHPLQLPPSRTNLSLPGTALPNPYPVPDTELLLHFNPFFFKPIPPDLRDRYPPLTCFEKAIRSLRSDIFNHGDKPLIRPIEYRSLEPLEPGYPRRWKSTCRIDPEWNWPSPLGTKDSVS